MKKLFTAFALGLLLVGCAREYDDSELRNRVTTLETKVGNLEANMKAIQTATNDGMFVQKVEELVEDGKVVGVTVTYTTGQVVTFQISGAGAETNLSAIRNAAGKLCWALNGKIIQVDGKDLEVGQTPTFSVENGHLFVTVDGKKTDVGAMGGGLGDAIFKDIKVTGSAVVLTMDDGSTIEIPFAKAFKLVIAKTQYAVTTTDPIEIPYTVENKTENTVVDVFTDANYEAAVDAEKITITPLAVVKGSALAYADSQVGLTSIVKLNFGAEAEPDTFQITDESIEYVAEAKDATVEAHAVSNLAFEVKPQVDWIHFVETRATNYTIVLSVDDNPTQEIRTGEVKIVRAGTEDVLQTITIAQKAGEAPQEPDFPSDAVLERKGYAFKISPALSENFLFTKENPHNFKQGGTFQVKFYANKWKSGNQVDRLCTFEARDENPAFLIRFSCDNTAPGALRINNNEWGLDLKVKKQGEDDFYICEAEKWHVLTLVVNPEGKLDIYDNGEFINSYTFNAGRASDFFLERFEVGMSWDEKWNNTGYSLSQLFDGYLDYARVWTRPLAQSEIAKGLCDVDNNAEGLMVKWVFGDTENAKTVNLAGDAAYDIDWSKAQQMDGNTIRKELDLSAEVENAIENWEGNLCDGMGLPEPDHSVTEREGYAFKISPALSENFLFTKEEPYNFKQGGTFQVKFYANKWKSGNQVDRLCTFEARDENPAFLIRFSCDNTAPGALRINNNEWGLDLKVKKQGEDDFYICEAEKWHVLTLVVNPEGKLDIYDNGEFINSYTFNAGRASDFFLERFEVGMSWDEKWNNTGYSLSQLFDGYLDYARVWTRPLAQSEIAKGLCDVDNNAEGLMVKWVFGDTENAKTVNLAGDAAYDIDWSKAQQMDGNTIRKELDLSSEVEGAIEKWEGNLCIF